MVGGEQRREMDWRQEYKFSQPFGSAKIHSLRVGWRNFFPVVLLCQFFGFRQEIGFCVPYLHI
jgi:hypothetical protein